MKAVSLVGGGAVAADERCMEDACLDLISFLSTTYGILTPIAILTSSDMAASVLREYSTFPRTLLHGSEGS